MSKKRLDLELQTQFSAVAENLGASRESNPNLQNHSLVCWPLQHKHHLKFEFELKSTVRDDSGTMPKPSNRFLELRTQFSAKAENCGLGRNRTCSLRGYNPVPYLMASNPFCEAKSLFTHSPTHTVHRCFSVSWSVRLEWLPPRQRAGDSNSQFPHQELPVFKTGPSSSRTPAIWRSQIPLFSPSHSHWSHIWYISVWEWAWEWRNGCAVEEGAGFEPARRLSPTTWLAVRRNNHSANLPCNKILSSINFASHKKENPLLQHPRNSIQNSLNHSIPQFQITSSIDIIILIRKPRCK